MKHRNNVMILSEILECCTIEATYEDIRKNVHISSGVITKHLNFLLSKGLLFKIIYRRVGKKRVRVGYTLLDSKKGREFLNGCREFKTFYKQYLHEDVL